MIEGFNFDIRVFEIVIKDLLKSTKSTEEKTEEKVVSDKGLVSFGQSIKQLLASKNSWLVGQMIMIAAFILIMGFLARHLIRGGKTF